MHGRIKVAVYHAVWLEIRCIVTWGVLGNATEKRDAAEGESCRRHPVSR